MVMQLPDTQYAEAGSAEIAYQVFGEGPIDLVAIGGPAAHLEVCWENADAARYLERLAEFSRVVRFDRRGTGLSDPLGGAPSLEEHVEDLATVMDAVGLGRAALLGEGDAGRLCALFAAMHPERVSKLILYGTSKRGSAVITRERRERLLRVIDEQWGQGCMLKLWAPSRVDDPHFARWWRRFEEAATSPETAREILAMTTQIDLTEVLSEIRTPTLVLHRRNDTLVPVKLGRELAEAIPRAEFVELSGTDNLVFAQDVDEMVAAVEGFLIEELRLASL
jgi:pimeloyl-ACP methyl ester carboxylesterase